MRKGKLGEPRFFHSSFSLQVEAPNIRVNPRAQGGGALYDLGVYCINTARHLFREEPTEVSGWPRAATTRASPTSRSRSAPSCASPATSWPRSPSASAPPRPSRYEVVGTKGTLRVEPAYDYEGGLALELTVGNKKTKRKKFKARNQIAAELAYFSECILDGTRPGAVGRSTGSPTCASSARIYRSIDEGRPVGLDALVKDERPTAAQERTAPAQKSEPSKVDVQPES